MEYILKTLTTLWILATEVETCTLPLAAGDWYSSTRGDWAVPSNQSQIQNFKADLSIVTKTATLDCVSQSSNMYILKTRFEIFFNLFVDVYTCIELIELSNNTFSYYIVTATDTNTGEEFTSNQASVCTNSNYKTAVNRHVTVLVSGLDDIGVTCPNVILGKYNIEYEDANGMPMTGVYMDVCNETDNKLLKFNSSDVAYTDVGTLTCLDYVISGSYVYLHTYNNESNSVNPARYRFACWVIANAYNPVTSGPVTATVSPSECVSGQTPTSIPSNGQKLTCTLTSANDFCGVLPTETEPFPGWKIALIVIGIIAGMLIILGIAVAIRYALKRRQSRKKETKIVKGELTSPDNVERTSPESQFGDDIARKKARLREEEGYDSGFDERTLQSRQRRGREKTFDLLEIKRSTRKEEGYPDDHEPVSGSNIQKKPNEEARELIEISPRKKSVQHTTRRPDEDNIVLTGQKKEREIQEKESKSKEEEIKGEQEREKDKSRDEKDDQALMRLKKERERREKERKDSEKKEEQTKEEQKEKEEKVKSEQDDRVIKTVRESSSSEEDETDESEREEKHIEKRRRSERSKDEFPEGFSDAKVVGRKKGRKHQKGQEAEDMVTTFTTRDQQDEQARRRSNRKKALKRIARSKLRLFPSDVETSESETDMKSSRPRYKRRKTERNRGRMAPYTEQYHVKKDIEKELDEIDYWNEKVTPRRDDEEDKHEIKTLEEPIQVAPLETAKPPEQVERTGLQEIMKEEADLWTSLGIKGFQIGPKGELPEGFSFDEFGNIVRAIDRKVIPKEDFERQMNLKKFGFVFSMPRLIRNTEGRPVGGYKDDEFGPTAEWDYGEAASNDEVEVETKTTEFQRAPPEKQVTFIEEDQKITPTPKDTDYNHIKGRQVGSAERGLLNKRLFDGKTNPDKDFSNNFVGQEGGVKPGSIYMEKLQTARQETARKSSTAPVGKPNMIVRSDTFDDGRPVKLRRDSNMQSSLKDQSDLIAQDEVRQSVKVDMNRDSALLDVKRKAVRPATDTNKPPSEDDRKMRKLLQEMYTDKKFFDHYLEAEKLQTNAGNATRGLVSHGLDFLKKKADYWEKQQSANRPPAPSELKLHLSRMSSFNTAGVLGMQSVPSSCRPFSADTAQEESRRATRENTLVVPELDLQRASTAEPTTRNPPTGRSEFAPSPSQLEKPSKEIIVASDDEPPKKQRKEKVKVGFRSPEPKDTGKVRNKNEYISEEYSLPGNVLSITEA